MTGADALREARRSGRLFESPHLVWGHPWRDRLVKCPLGVGRFGWTNGRVVAVYSQPDVALLVDLVDVSLAEPEGAS